MFTTKPIFWRDYGIPILFILLFLSKIYDRFKDANHLRDFNLAYYPAGHIILDNPAKLYANVSVDGFVNLPISAYLFTPFSLLSEHDAGVLFTLLGVLSVFITGYSLLPSCLKNN